MMVPYEFATEWQYCKWTVRVWGYVRWVVDSLWSALRVQAGPGERVLLMMVAENRYAWSQWAALRGHKRVPNEAGMETWIRTMNAQFERD